jgi:hypothetical protein
VLVWRGQGLLAGEMLMLAPKTRKLLGMRRVRIKVAVRVCVKVPVRVQALGFTRRR